MTLLGLRDDSVESAEADRATMIGAMAHSIHVVLRWSLVSLSLERYGSGRLSGVYVVLACFPHKLSKCIKYEINRCKIAYHCEVDTS